MKHLFATLIVTFGFSISAMAEDLTIGLWQGDFSTKFEESTIKPWVDSTGSSVSVTSNSDLPTRLRAAMAVGDSVWDVVTVSGENERMLCEAGQLVPLGEELDGSLDHLNSAANCGVPFLSFGQTISFVGFQDDQPESAADFFDEQRFPGKRGMLASPKGALELALLADGVGFDEVYQLLASDEGLERAFEKLETISPLIIWADNGSQAVQLLNDGEVALSTTWSSSVQRALIQGAELGVTKDFMMVEYDYLAVPMTSKRAQQATDFVSYATTPEGLSGIYKGYDGQFSIPWTPFPTFRTQYSFRLALGGHVLARAVGAAKSAARMLIGSLGILRLMSCFGRKMPMGLLSGLTHGAASNEVEAALVASGE